jgi:hypothetical protein
MWTISWKRLASLADWCGSADRLKATRLADPGAKFQLQLTENPQVSITRKDLGKNVAQLSSAASAGKAFGS